MATLSLAKWATDLSPTDIPKPVLKAAQRSLYNYIGCAIGGSSHPTVQKARKALLPFSGPPTSTLLGCNHTESNHKADAQHACLLNGISSHVHDYDDTHLATIIHPTGPVASAALAYIEHTSSTEVIISGADLPCALAAGIEASCKLGLAVWPSHYDLGWHITSTIGSVRAAQNGFLAALLAEQGFTSSLQALEAKRGWANVVVGGGEPRLETYFSELGSVWEIEKNAFQPFPCGIVCHPAIDGCIQLAHDMQQRDCSVADIEKVEQKVHPLVMELTSKRRPKDGLEAKFSVFHGSAVGLLYGKAGPAEYADEVVVNPDVIALRDKIEAIADDNIHADEVSLTIHLKDGTVLEKHVRHAVGSVEVPMSDDQLTKKFIDQVSLVAGEDGAREASELAWALSVGDDIAKVIARL